MRNRQLAFVVATMALASSSVSALAQVDNSRGSFAGGLIFSHPLSGESKGTVRPWWAGDSSSSSDSSVQGLTDSSGSSSLPGTSASGSLGLSAGGLSSGLGIATTASGGRKR